MNYKIKKDCVQLLNDNKNIGNFQNESSVGTHKNSDNINLPSLIYIHQIYNIELKVLMFIQINQGVHLKYLSLNKCFCTQLFFSLIFYAMKYFNLIVVNT